MYQLEHFTLCEVAEKSAVHYGTRPALSMVGAYSISYADLGRISFERAAALAAQGIGKGDRVALLAENSPYWVVSWFSIVRAGGIVVPILIDFTPDQIRNIIMHAEAKAVVVSEKLRAKVADLPSSIHLLDVRKWDGMEHAVASFVPPKVDPDDLAEIVYTSGTTGLSKGVMLTHRNLLSNATACKSIIVLHRTDRLLSILPLAHTYEFTIGTLIPLLAGSHIHYLDRPPAATVLLPALQAVRPTIMLSVPLVIEKIYRSSIKPTLDGMKLYHNPLFKPIITRFAGFKLRKTFGGKLRFFGIGGAPLAADVEEFLKQSGFPYAIGYGLTETSPLLAGCGPRHTHLRSTGPALQGVQLRIADPRPDTGEGEIQAKGPNIFKGYWRDEARTREAFTEDGWFRTGDLGVFDDKGRLYIRGRSKTMILGPSGENIYPEEIEAVLNQSPYVAESLVVEEDGALTALVCLKSEVLEKLEARLEDSLEAAGQLGSNVGRTLADAEKSVAQTVGHAFTSAEKAAEHLLESIRKEANAKLAAFSRIRTVKLQIEPFEKTPTQKIKRFLYGSAGKAPGKEKEGHRSRVQPTSPTDQNLPPSDAEKDRSTQP
ncbi:MAG: AMP-binding protein [Spirochaetaceae bacterium]|nr:AMP-binding protein [Spirochaetaceae bacterium]